MRYAGQFGGWRLKKEMAKLAFKDTFLAFHTLDLPVTDLD